MRRKLFLSFMSALLFYGASQAAPIDPARALDIARDFAGNAVSNRLMRKAHAAVPTFNLVYTHADAVSGHNAFYVFNRGSSEGYVLVSADDRAPAILGYSDTGDFDSSKIPASMSGMISSWTSQIAWLSEHPEARAATPAKVNTAIEPLLGDIMWDQGDPYNRKCPTVTQYNNWGDPKGKGPAPTGCVAMALGQIMYYHKWPEQGLGSISYTSEGYDDTNQVDVTFDGVRYNWDAMLPSLTSKSSSDAIDAVSTLLYHAGAAFESQYDGMGTGATDVSVAPAMVKYFGYDKGINYVKRDFYTTDDWNELLINEFENKRPVAYGGVTRRKEGHFFVLDGVNADGYYHVNWGWNGMENGYYMLTLLEPGSQGIGGASDGGAFSYAQNMIIGIRKPVEDSALNYNFTCGSLDKFDKTIGRQETALLKAVDVWNDSPNEVTANLGFVLIDSDGKVVYSQMVKKEIDYPVAYGENALACSFIIPDDIKPGQYTIRPAYQLSVDEYASYRMMQTVPGRASYYNVTVTDETLAYSVAGAYQLSIQSVSGDNEGDIESGITTKLTLKVRNDGGEFYGPVQLRLFINGMEKTFGRHDFPSSAKKALWVHIPGNTESEVTFDIGKLDLPGHDDYVVRLWGNEGIFGTNEDGNSTIQNPKNLATLTGVKIIGPALPPVLEVVDDMILTTAVDGKVPMNDVGLKVCLDNEGGEWTGSLRGAVYDPESWSWDPIGYVTFDSVTIEGATTEQWITLTGGELPAACEVGKEYEITILEPDGEDAMIPSKYSSIEFIAGEPVEKIPDLSLDDITFIPEEIVAGVPSNVQFHISNAGFAYNGVMHFKVSRDSEVMHTSAKQNVNIARNDEAVIDFTETFELPTASDYTVTLYDNEDKEIGKRENLTFTADVPALELTEASQIPSTIKCEEPTEFTFTVKNTGYRFDGTLHFVLISDDDVKFTSQPKPLALARGEEAVLNYTETFNFPNGLYVLRVLTAEDETVGERTLNISGYNAVAGVQPDDIEVQIKNEMVYVRNIRPSLIAVYAADGRLISSVANSDSMYLGALSAGTYIIRIESAQSNKIVKFIK